MNSMFHVDLSVEHLCGNCSLRPRRKGGRWCGECHAADMRERRRIARKRLVKAGLALRRGRLDGQLGVKHVRGG